MATQLSVVTAENIKKVRRKPRRPQHQFRLKSKPFEIVPFCIAPVLPGETLQNILLQSRAVTDPIKSRIMGWHKEYYFFYVPLLSLKRTGADSTGLLQSMMLDPTVDVSTLKYGANNAGLYGFKGGMKYTEMCLDVVCDEFFRDEDDTTAHTIDVYPGAQVDQQRWFNSFKLESAGQDDMELPGVDEIEELDILPGMTAAYAQWEMMRDAGITDLDYDDFIRSYGVDVPKAEEIQPDSHGLTIRPELLRFSRSWQYPSNTIDPADGSAVSAVSWSIAERADKARFFKYPGFIFGVTVTRPKLYMKNQIGSAAGLLDNAYAWLPAVLAGHPYASVKEVLDSTTDGIFQNLTEDYWFDVKDLFLYGDQYVNDFAGADSNWVALPTATGEVKFVTKTQIDGLFVGDTTAAYIKEDGVVHLNILGRVTETTP
jgi:hypothetical protein